MVVGRRSWSDQEIHPGNDPSPLANPHRASYHDRRDEHLEKYSRLEGEVPPPALRDVPVCPELAPVGPRRGAHPSRVCRCPGDQGKAGAEPGGPRELDWLGWAENGPPRKLVPDAPDPLVTPKGVSYHDQRYEHAEKGMRTSGEGEC